MGGTALRVQSTCVLAVAALALVIALGWLYASVPQPPPVHLIKCAAVSEGSPCGPDPAMQQLGFPRPLPFNAPPEVDPPQFAPSRWRAFPLFISARGRCTR